jgi:hypothetical protein
VNCLPGLSLNRDPPDLCLMSSKDYRREPPALGLSDGVLIVVGALVERRDPSLPHLLSPTGVPDTPLWKPVAHRSVFE